MESIKKILFFEKESGTYMGVLDSEELAQNINKDLFITKEVYLKPNEYWEGDYESGKIYDKRITPIVYEQKLLDETYAEVLASYPLFKQINNIIEVLDNNINIQKTKEFSEMVSFIKNKKLKLKQKIQHLSSDKKAFNFIRIEDEEKTSSIN